MLMPSITADTIKPIGSKMRYFKPTTSDRSIIVHAESSIISYLLAIGSEPFMVLSRYR